MMLAGSLLYSLSRGVLKVGDERNRDAQGIIGGCISFMEWADFAFSVKKSPNKRKSVSAITPKI